MLKDLLKLATDFKEINVPTPKECTTVIAEVEDNLRRQEANSYQSPVTVETFPDFDQIPDPSPLAFSPSL